MTVKAFHHNRRIFFVKANGLLEVTKHYPGTHEMFAGDMNLSDWLDLPRGFYWPPTNELFFYYGMYTEDYLAVTEKMKAVIRALLVRLGGDSRTIIHGGMYPGEPGQVWTPVHTFGTISEFLSC